MSAENYEAENTAWARVCELERERDNLRNRIKELLDECHGLTSRILRAEAEVARLRALCGEAADLCDHLAGVASWKDSAGKRTYDRLVAASRGEDGK